MFIENLHKRLLLKIFLLLNFNLFCYQALIIKNVADLTGNKTLEDKMPYSYKNTFEECPRLYQGLYNEVVEVKNKFKDKSEIIFENVIYRESPESAFFIKNNEIINLKELTKFKKYIPKFNDQHISLIEPIKTKSFNFSAGTKFVFESYNKDKKEYECIFITPELKTKKIKIKKDLCIKNKERSKEEKIKIFLKVLKNWDENQNGFIPYLWGGGSYLYRIPNKENFVETKSGQNYLNYNYETKSGLDCSSMILRASQIAGLNLKARNTTMIGNMLKNLDKKNNIQNGDLILFKGHVIVILDKNKDLCIEARGYNPHEFGKIHTSHIKDLFKNTKNLNELKNNFHKKQPLIRLNKSGKVIQTIPEFRILKI